MALTADQKSELRAWRVKGWTLRALGAAFGISHEWVRHYLNGCDLKFPAGPQIGETYGRLTVIGQGQSDRFGNRRFWVQCECGNVKDLPATRLNRGERHSCGCARNLNDRRLRVITIDGRTQHLSAWLRETGLSYRCFWLRVRAGWTDEEALTRPRQAGRRLDGREKRKGGKNANE